MDELKEELHQSQWPHGRVAELRRADGTVRARVIELRNSVAIFRFDKARPCGTAVSSFVEGLKSLRELAHGC